MEGEKKDESEIPLNIKECITNGVVDCFFEDDGKYFHEKSNQDEILDKKCPHYKSFALKKKPEKKYSNSLTVIDII